jgi:hypothetical protein
MHVRCTLLIVRAIRLLSGREAALFVEVASREVGRKRPQLQSVRPQPLGLLKQRAADAARLPAGPDIQLVDPPVLQREQTDQLTIRRLGNPALQLRDQPESDPSPNLVI